MNIDIVNKQVSKKLGANERKVTLTNKFYWRKVYDHLYGYDDRPITIENVCVFYQDKYLIKKQIKKYVSRIRATIISKKFAPISPKREGYIESYKKNLRELWRLRKLNKYTN